jgi:hypothetical protein
VQIDSSIEQAERVQRRLAAALQDLKSMSELLRRVQAAGPGTAAV